jgi:hypothetical protein
MSTLHIACRKEREGTRDAIRDKYGLGGHERKTPAKEEEKKDEKEGGCSLM